MTYTLNNKLAEAKAAYTICESVRAILNKELHEGRSKEELIQKLIGFYRSMSPRMADHLEAAEGLWQFDHLASVLSSHIYIYLQADEFVDFTKVRAFLKETWPDVVTESFENPEQFGYVSIGGEKFAINPRVIAVGKTAELLLEKAWTGAIRKVREESGRPLPTLYDIGESPSDVGRAHPDQSVDIDMSKPVNHSYLGADKAEAGDYMSTPKPLNPDVIFDQQSGMYLEKTGPDHSGTTSNNPLFHRSTPEELAKDTIVRTPPTGKDEKVVRSLNVDYCGDTLYGELPVRRQRQTLVSKRWLKKQQRQKFNNMSLKRKNDFRKVERMTGKVLIR